MVANHAHLVAWEKSKYKSKNIESSNLRLCGAIQFKAKDGTRRNILMNALHAMPHGGTLTIKTYAKQLTGIGHNAGSRKTDHFRIGGTLVIAEVEDTGTGIPEDQLSKVFDPFFTTKSTGKGTGLGLTVSKKIIDLHGGTINIGNRKGGGVRATIMFKA